jgi:tetratricopeptide (TPR) repeat protein
MSARRELIWDRWEEIDRILERLLEIDASRRGAELSRFCHGDPALERTLSALLAASEEDGRVNAGPTPRLVSAALEQRAASEAAPERVGPYRVIARLGRGGMGSVYLVERDDPSFPNRVALKLLRRGTDTDDVLARFRAERQILASLHHPGIATVFDAGTSEDGRPYLVMEYVEGRPLTAHCDAKRLDIRARLALFMAVLRAVSHAHGQGVVHRDLKPSNILVTEAEAHVKLLDFGIAKLVDPGDAREDELPTRPGTRPMTPGFASPEQVLGLPITEASDIYQLGLLLHELLTGARPFEDHSAREYERSVTTTEPDPPSRTLRTQPRAVPMSGVADTRALARMLTGDLDAIVLRCLQRDPAARYESVDALHEDIGRHLGGRPVAARRATRIYRFEKWFRRRASLLAVPVVASAAIAASWLIQGGSFATRFSDRPVRWLAAGRIVDETDGGAPHLAHQITELLVTNLARTGAVQVVRLPGAGEDVELRQAALQAGVTEVIAGSVRTLASGELELLLRRTRAESGRQLDSVRIRGANAFALVDRASTALLAQYGVRDATLQVAGVTTSNPRAYAFYIEGLVAYRTGDNRIADRFFHAALGEDSTFAMAAFHASRTTDDYDRHAGMQLLNRANRLAARASDRERLMIRARWAAAMDDPLLAVFADSLVRRFPAEPEGPYLLGVDQIHAGRFHEASAHLERAVALDSLSLHAPRAPCIACDALANIAVAYRSADSMVAAVRVGERWTRLQPASARAWHSLASSLLYAERYDDALRARSRAAALRVGGLGDLLFPGLVAMHRGDFDEADRLFRVHLSTGTRTMRVEASHWLAISLRMQGRWNEALEAAEALLEASRPGTPDDWWDIPARMHRALALLGSGRAREAAQLFEANVRSYPEYTVSRTARAHTWHLTHAGTARAADNDTAALAALAERIETIGAGSIYARDQRLHHYHRALLARARGAPEFEIEQHLRAALYSLPHGYSRINLELAESLLRQRRYAEAAAIAAAALRNSSESNGMYATRTDFHELLGRIWHAAGQPDSAAVHLRAAQNAWRAADPNMRPRIENIEVLLASIER